MIIPNYNCTPMQEKWVMIFKCYREYHQGVINAVIFELMIMPHLIKIQKATFLQLNWELVAFELQNV